MNMPVNYECSDCGFAFSLGAYHGIPGDWHDPYMCSACGTPYVVESNAEGARLYARAGPVEAKEKRREAEGGLGALHVRPWPLFSDEVLIELWGEALAE